MQVGNQNLLQCLTQTTHLVTGKQHGKDLAVDYGIAVALAVFIGLSFLRGESRFTSSIAQGKKYVEAGDVNGASCLTETQFESTPSGLMVLPARGSHAETQQAYEGASGS